MKKIILVFILGIVGCNKTENKLTSKEILKKALQNTTLKIIEKKQH